MYAPHEVMDTYLTQVVLEGRLELIETLAHDDMVDEANQSFGGPPGRDGLVAHVVGFRRNIDRLRLSIDQIVGHEKQVMAQWSFSGKHIGPWLNQPPTGRDITGTVFSFFDLSDGRISRYRVWLHANFDEPLIFDSANPRPQNPPL